MHCYFNWVEICEKTKQETKLSTLSQPALPAAVLPAWEGLLKQSTLAGSKCPPNVPPGSTAHCFLIVLE